MMIIIIYFLKAYINFFNRKNVNFSFSFFHYEEIRILGLLAFVMALLRSSLLNEKVKM